MRNATDSAKLTFDVLQLIFRGSMVKPVPGSINCLKQNTPFIKTSYDEFSMRLLQGPLLEQLRNFDLKTINEETIELLQPYLTLEAVESKERIFDYKVAMKASSALAQLVNWARNTATWVRIDGKVAPLHAAVDAANAKLQAAKLDLHRAQADLFAVNSGALEELCQA